MEQQALERWKLQKEAQIEQMMRDGVPLGAVAAALASPETAERIAVLEAATSGGLSALDAARLNVQRAGHDLALLNGLDGLRGSSEAQETTRDREEPAALASPLSQLVPVGSTGDGERSAVVTVALTEGLPEARGRTWTAEDYAKRWLRLTVPTGDPNRGRWPEHPTWIALREGFAPLALREAELPERSLDLVRAARYTGYRRLLDRMAVGLTTTLEQMDTDPGAALVSYVKYLHRIAGRIKRMQNKRAAAWRCKEQEASRMGCSSPLIPDLQRGLGARLDTPTRAEKRVLLLDMALGVFSSAGVVYLRVQREADVSNLGDLLLYSLDDLEEIAAEKGGIRQLLDEKWRKVYKANTPRGLFTTGEFHAA